MKGLPILLGFAVLAVALIVLGSWLARRRRETLRQWAEAKGLRFDPEKDRQLSLRFARFPAFARGSDRYGFNRMEGTWGTRPVLAFDYHYETESTDSKGNRQTQDHHFSAVALQSELPLKPLFLRPEHLLDRLGAFFGLDDIDFESAEFSRRFHVKSPDRKWAYDVLHVRSMEFLLAHPPFQLALQNDLAVAWHDRTFQPEDFDQAAQVLSGLLDGLPDYVRREALPPPLAERSTA